MFDFYPRLGYSLLVNVRQVSLYDSLKESGIVFLTLCCAYCVLAGRKNCISSVSDVILFDSKRTHRCFLQDSNNQAAEEILYLHFWLLLSLQLTCQLFLSATQAVLCVSAPFFLLQHHFPCFCMHRDICFSVKWLRAVSLEELLWVLTSSSFYALWSVKELKSFFHLV